MVNSDRSLWWPFLQNMIAFLVLFTQETVESSPTESLMGSDTVRRNESESFRNKLRTVYGRLTLKGMQPLQMKKIGLEIPESTRKDMELSRSNLLSRKVKTRKVSKNQSTSRRRELQMTCMTNEYYSNSMVTCVSCSMTFNYCDTCSEYSCNTCQSGYIIDYTNTCVVYNPAPTCNSNQYSSAGSCYDCTSYCTSCTSGSDCSSCATDYYLSLGTCVYSSPSNYNYNIPNCQSYSSGSYCSQCSPNYYLYDSGSDRLCGSCPSGTYTTSSSSTNCDSCSWPCTQCSGSASFCTSCDPSYPALDPNSGTCTTSTTCSPGMFWNTGSGSCDYCGQFCNVCSSNSQCTECSSGNYMQANGSSCSPNCDGGSYLLGTGCVYCDSGCSACSGSGNCYTCYSGYYLYSGQCSNSCPAGYTGDSANWVCSPDSNPGTCDWRCSGCTSYSNPSACTGCDSSRTLNSNNYCELTCNSNEFFDMGSDACQPCSASCGGSCYGSSISCTNCNSDQYLDTSQHVCVSCGSPCVTCSGSSDHCTACGDGLILTTSNRCQTSCDLGEFNLGNGMCGKCYGNCMTCSGPGMSECSQCHTNYFFDLGNSNCTANCSARSYANISTLRCEPCSYKCSNCTEGSDFACTSCDSIRRLRPDNYCELRCSPTQQYYDQDMDTCGDCHPTCGTRGCKGPSAADCTPCPDYFYVSTCVTTCPSSSYAVIPNKTCQPCDSSCLTCSGSANNQCLTCNSTLYLTVGKQCKSACDVREYPDTSKKCFGCHATCLKCSGSGSTECTSCDSGKYLNPDGQCLSTCPIKYFSNAAINVCEGCGYKCETCSVAGDPYKCLTCESGRYLRADNYCEITCSSGHYYVQNNDTCDTCHASCTSCIGSNATDCSSCPDYSNNGICVTTCPSNTYAVIPNKTCQPCDSSCLTCSGSANNQCLTCNSTLYLTGSKQCKSSCNLHEFADGSKFCHACHSSCNSCSSTSPLACLSCSSPNYLTPDGSCASECPEHYTRNPAGMNCLSCASTCLRCSSPANQFACTECESPRVLREDNDCTKPCPKGLYYDEPSDICLLCHSKCASCTGESETQCLTCANGLFRSYTDLCVAACPVDSYLNGTTCFQCHRSCKTCTGTSPNNCTSCVASQVLTVSGYCKDECDDREFKNSQGVCEGCHSTCRSCNSTGEEGCTGCLNSSITSLSKKGSCVNCLDQADSDPETCWYSVRLTLTKPSTKAVSLTASTTVRLTFQNESLFNSRLDGVLLKRVLEMSVNGINPADWSWEVRFASGEIIFDLFFSGGQEGLAVLTVTPKERIILTNSAGGAELIFKNQSSKFDIQIREAPDVQMIGALSQGTAQAENIGKGFSTVSSALSILAVAATSGLGAPLLKILRILKLVSRLRLINVFFGSYLELFLQAVGNLYKIGGDDINLSTIKLVPNSRGKLDMYAVSVVSTDAVGVKYAIYYLSVAVRLYRSSIRKYVSQRGSMTMVDSLLDNVGERCSTLLLIMVGIDIFFYSLRCVSHMDRQVHFDFMDHCSLVLSMLTIMLFTLEFVMILDLNKKTAFHSLQKALRRKQFMLKKAAAIAPLNDIKSRKTDLIPDSNANQKRAAAKGTSIIKKNSTENNLQEASDNQFREASNWDDISPKSDKDEEYFTSSEEDEEKVDINDKKRLYGYRQQKRVIDNPSAEQFFGNGIKLHKLRTPEGRYYNTVALAKLFIFEPLFINLQMFSTAQVLSIFLLQCGFVYWTGRAGMFVKVFSSPLSYIALMLNELAMLIFLGVGTCFQLLGGETNVSATASTKMQLLAVGVISLACVIGFVEFFVSVIAAIVTAVRDRKLKMAQKAVNNHRDEMKSVRHRVIGRDLPGAEPPVPPVDADMSSSVADIKANQVGQSAKPVLGKTRLAPGKRLSRPPLQPLARK